jgi:hypothetical protein
MSEMTMEDKMTKSLGIAIGALSKIANDYQTPEELRRNPKDDYGLDLDYEEALEMSYKNMQGEAQHAMELLKKLNGGKS